MKIVILGYMGSGKSTVGRLLAREMGTNFIDLDQYIEEQLHTSIPELFRLKGEIFFRKTEHNYLKEILHQPKDAVISLGGGTPCYSGNMATILQHTPHVFYLRMPIAVLLERLKKEKSDRPLISDIPDEELPAFIGKHLFERRNFYEMATHTIDAGKKPPEELVEEIKKQLV